MHNITNNTLSNKPEYIPNLSVALKNGDIDFIVESIRTILNSNMPETQKIKLLSLKNKTIPTFLKTFIEGNTNSVIGFVNQIINNPEIPEDIKVDKLVKCISEIADMGDIGTLLLKHNTKNLGAFNDAVANSSLSPCKQIEFQIATFNY